MIKAVQKSELQNIKLYLTHKACPSIFINSGSYSEPIYTTPLIELLKKPDYMNISVLQDLLNNNKCLLFKAPNGDNILHILIKHFEGDDKFQIPFKALITLKAAQIISLLNMKNSNGETPLHLLASYNYSFKIFAEILHPDIKSKVKFKSTNDQGLTPFMILAQQEQPDSTILYELFTLSKPTLLDNQNNTVLHLAAYANNAKTFIELATYFKNLNMLDEMLDKLNIHNQTAFDIAQYSKNYKIIDFLNNKNLQNLYQVSYRDLSFGQSADQSATLPLTKSTYNIDF